MWVTAAVTTTLRSKHAPEARKSAMTSVTCNAAVENSNMSMSIQQVVELRSNVHQTNIGDIEVYVGQCCTYAYINLETAALHSLEKNIFLHVYKNRPNV